MAGTGPAAGGGLLRSIRKLAATLVGTAQTRLQLLGNEIQEEGLRLQRVLVLAVLAVFFLVFSVALLTLFVIVAFWDSNRLLVIGLFALLYLGVGAGLGVAARRLAAGPSHLFQASVAELGKDRASLSS